MEEFNKLTKEERDKFLYDFRAECSIYCDEIIFIFDKLKATDYIQIQDNDITEIQNSMNKIAAYETELHAHYFMFKYGKPAIPTQTNMFNFVKVELLGLLEFCKGIRERLEKDIIQAPYIIWEKKNYESLTEEERSLLQADLVEKLQSDIDDLNVLVNSLRRLINSVVFENPAVGIKGYLEVETVSKKKTYEKTVGVYVNFKKDIERVEIEIQTKPVYTATLHEDLKHVTLMDNPNVKCPRHAYLTSNIRIIYAHDPETKHLRFLDIMTKNEMVQLREIKW